MHKQRNTYIFILICIFVMGFLLFSLIQMQGYANIINDAGIIRGGTQRSVKLELNNEPNDELVTYLDELIQKLEATESKSFYTSRDSAAYQENLAAVKSKWGEIKAEIPDIRATSTIELREHFLNLSEQHFDLANKMVYAAQYRAENELRNSIILSVIMILAVSLIMYTLERRSQQELERVFYTDPLTALPNQASFEINAAEKLRAASPGAYLMVYLNLNNFKFVNDSYGYTAGDKLLLSFSATLKRFCNSSEICAHLHADHFAILLKKREHVIEDLQTAILESIENERDLNLSDILTCDYGIYTIPDPDEAIASCLSKANVALKEGRSSRRSVAYYDQHLLDKITNENKMTRWMRQGLSENEFQLYLQSKVNLEQSKVTGAEVLVRWNSEPFGFLPPDEFIPLFEKNGFIVELDFYVLEETCRILKQSLSTAPDRTIVLSVNVSRVTLFQNDFIKRFVQMAERYEVPPEYLEIEITENVFIFDSSMVEQILSQLRSYGFSISMDDFGSGYSSLNLLRELPIDVLKIDRIFLQESIRVEKAYAIVKSVVEMAHSLNMVVVCEGVETLEHAEFLKTIHCAIGQGYYFSKPIPLGAFQEKYHLLTTQKHPDH
ncbi:bifunctional diguanylate cyclase/phosphodiesterase [Eubacterium sp. 1001713B170207_170306_E7]|uniref:putative bifunctional diguanylate cyclase/phosphodiesterase n=1 Tax=Eubacterium sp. 1001713B170207_170306_E7 TaxID=2787097 RepID=UPI0018993261|nr:bifunctional diguanylate cyclase/phosphodiesterase [Eubacterium sp. 1001713B170207_170306_E7]